MASRNVYVKMSCFIGPIRTNCGFCNANINLEGHLSSQNIGIIMSDLGQEKTMATQEMIDTMKALIIQEGKDCGFEVVENYDLGAGPVHVVWNFKPGSEAIPDMRLGFICMTDVSARSKRSDYARDAEPCRQAGAGCPFRADGKREEVCNRIDA